MIDRDSFNFQGNFVPELHLSKDGVVTLYEYETKCYSSIMLQLTSILNKFEFYDLMVKDTISSADNDYWENRDRNCIVSFVRYNQGVSGYFLNVFYTESYRETFKKLKKAIDKFKVKEEDSKEDKVNFICQYNGGMELMEKELKKLEVYPHEDYELSLPFEKIKIDIGSNRSGLILFTGSPGTGKSSLVRHLISICNKKFVYIPVNVAQVLSDPSFINFAMENLSNSVIIIEDAETVLADRQKSYNAAASTLLNLTDGLLGELLGIRVLATINTEDGVDSALLRKGRLLSKVTFDKLGHEKAKKILKRIGKEKYEIKENTKYSLAELYNVDVENGEEEKERRKIGF